MMKHKQIEENGIRESNVKTKVKCSLTLNKA